MTLTTLAILGFVLIQLGIGYWASRRIAHEDDYLVAGRRLGPWVAGFSLFVTWFGAESILRSSAAIHPDGLAGGRADPFGYGQVRVRVRGPIPSLARVERRRVLDARATRLQEQGRSNGPTISHNWHAPGRTEARGMDQSVMELAA